MELQPSDAVFQSYGRCCASEHFFEDFYRVFQGKSDEVRSVFVNTDMDEQRRLLRAGIMWLIMVARGASDNKLAHLGKTHNREGYNIQPYLYEYWLEALLETVAKHDKQHSDDLGRHWRTVLQPSIDKIRGAY